MNEFINKIENGNYELVIRCSDYENFKSFEKTLMNELTKISKEKAEPDKICNSENNHIRNYCMACSDKYKNEWKSILEKTFRKSETEKECSSCKCKADKEIPKYEKDIKSDIPDFTALNIDKTNNFGIMWAFIIITMVFLCSGNNNYYKGMGDAYEPNKKEENMQKAREAFAKLKKSLENLTIENKNKTERET